MTMAYNAYGFFDSIDLTTWAADTGIDGRARSRGALLTGELDEESGKENTRFGAPGEGTVVGGDEGRPWTPGNLGIFILSCQDGDVRMSEKGLSVYGLDGHREVPVFQPGGQGMALDSEVLELYDAVKNEKPLFHDGRWGMASAEVQWAIIESSRLRREVQLQHQVPVPPGF